MVRIICPECKNAFLQKNDDSFACPSCEATFAPEEENLLTGIQYFKEGDYNTAGDFLMKYIVQNGAEPRAIFIKALCDASQTDEDTFSLKGMYDKLTEALADIPDEHFVTYLAMANDEAEKIERALVEKHMKLFEDADAEKIKKEVTTIITIQNDAKDFRKALSSICCDYSLRTHTNISTRFSECYYVEPESASAAGNVKYEKITANIAAHTVFTGSLSTDIKNLEIYYRCIVMFFKKNRDKYDFLMVSAEKFAELSKLLEEGKYSTIKGTSAIGDKLKSAAYDFFQESLKDHDEPETDREESVLVIEPEVIEVISEEATEEESTSNPEDTYEDIYSTETETDDNSDSDDSAIVMEDISSVTENLDDTSAEDDVVPEEAEPEQIETAVEEQPAEEVTEAEVAEDSEIIEVVNEASDNDTDEPEEPSVADETDEPEEDALAEEASDEATSDTAEATQEAIVRKHKKNYAPFIAIILVVAAIIAIVAIRVIPPKLRSDKYTTAINLSEQEHYDKAAALFLELGSYEDSEKLYLENTYAYATQLEEGKHYADAKAVYAKLGDYLNSTEKVDFCTYSDGIEKLNAGSFDEAKALFDTIPEYEDSADLSNKCLYKKAESLIDNKKFTEAVAILETITSYNEAVADMILEAQYLYVTANLKADNETTMTYIANLVTANYKDSASLKDFLVSENDPADTPPEDTTHGQTTATTPATGNLVIITNSDKSDSETDTTEFDSDRSIYIHVNCNDPALYGKELKMSYESKYSSGTLRRNVFTEEEPSYSFRYTGDGTRNYDIIFRLADAEGNTLYEETVSVN